MANIVKFEIGQPVEVALKYTEGKVYDGDYGERVMYSLTDGRVMYLDPLTAARIKSLGVQPGEAFFILKSKKGRLTEWSVFREGDEPPVEPPTRKRTPPAHVLAERLPEIVAARNAGANLEQQLADSITLVEAKKAAGRATAAVPSTAAAPARAELPAPSPATNGSNSTSAEERWKAVLLKQTNALTDVLAEALRHSSQHGGLVKSEDVRSMMLSAFINLAKGGNQRAA